jgi:hypothetical protein
MQYPTKVEYKSRLKDGVSGKKVNTLILRSKKFNSRTKAKKFLKDHPLKQFIGIVSEGRPEQVKEEV